MSFPRYPKYKDSGVEWLGKVPEHWSVSRLKCAAIGFYSGGTPESDNSNYWSDDEGDAVAWVAIGDMTRSSIVESTDRRLTLAGLASKDLQVLPAGTLLYSMYASLGKVAVLGIPAAINQAILGIVPDTGVAVQSFLRYWLNQVEQHLELFASSNTQANLNAAKVRGLPLLIPPLIEQSAIASFLDRETAKIDALVAQQQRLMELLKEKRQAVISHAVTKGLNPDAPMKPSGVEWLGEVPAHWEAGPLKRWIESVESGTSVNAVDEPAPEDTPGVLKTSCVYTGQFTPEENKRVVPEEIDRVTCTLKELTLIVSRMNTPELIGAAGYVERAPANLFLPDRLWQIAFSNDCCPRFAHYWTQTSVYRSQVKIACSGTSSSMKSLAQEEFGQFGIAVPPRSEQEAIVRYLGTATSQLDRLLDQARHAISLLLERRSALISAAVTGQIDVRHLAMEAAA